MCPGTEEKNTGLLKVDSGTLLGCFYLESLKTHFPTSYVSIKSDH